MKIHIISLILCKEVDEEDAAPNYDPYDMLVRQLTYEKKEARGGVRLKTEDEVVKVTKLTLDSLH